MCLLSTVRVIAFRTAALGCFEHLKTRQMDDVTTCVTPAHPFRVERVESFVIITNSAHIPAAAAALAPSDVSADRAHKLLHLRHQCPRPHVNEVAQGEEVTRREEVRPREEKVIGCDDALGTRQDDLRHETEAHPQRSDGSEFALGIQLWVGGRHLDCGRRLAVLEEEEGRVTHQKLFEIPICDDFRGKNGPLAGMTASAVPHSGVKAKTHIFSEKFLGIHHSPALRTRRLHCGEGRRSVRPILLRRVLCRHLRIRKRWLVRVELDHTSRAHLMAFSESPSLTAHCVDVLCVCV